jgi:putative FmdB family regulatory protein
MPTYEYHCKACGHAMEEFQSMSDPPLVRCPRCDTDNLVRVLGAGAGVFFKGTGFYVTDYPKNSSSPPSPGAKKPPSPTPEPKTPPPADKKE